ncbi:hypothetical protein M3Y97_00755600 [Aphelenchoides bicaudatus]|nr:hypothetical protein M3Y97_00755600 [Aphelenchoides bicaudatus]
MFKTLTFVAVLACAMVAVWADGDDFGCDLCTSIIKDFTPELKDGTLKSYLDRLCDDLTTDAADYDEQCREAGDSTFAMIQALLDSGESPKAVCQTIGGCGFDLTSLQRRLFQHVQRVRSKHSPMKQLRMRQLLKKQKN